MSKEIILSKKNNIKIERFNNLIKTIYNLLLRYNKDYKDSTSWIHSYGKQFNIKFPIITFHEPNKIFLDKITKILDLMELTHLYCKITNPNLYEENIHKAVSMTRKLVYEDMIELTPTEFDELKIHVKSSILYGNN